MELDGSIRKELNEALRHAFRDPDDLKRFLDYSLDKKLNEITYGGNLVNTVYDVIENAVSDGWIRALIATAYQEKPDNPKLRAFVKQHSYASLSFDIPPIENVEKLIKSKTEPFLSAVDWTSKSIEVLHQVCCIEVALQKNKEGYGKTFGTGFLLGPNIVMTNYHVMEEAIKGQEKHAQGKPWARLEDVIFRFGYFEQNDNQQKSFVQTYALADENWLIAFSPPPPDGLDYALLRVNGDPGNQLIQAIVIDTPAARGWIKPVAALEEDYETGMPLPILQHPDGGPLVIDWGTILGFSDDKTRLRYTTNTKAGSSGAPCFNRNWEVIAMHRAGGSGSDDFNSGIPFNIILKDLEQKGIGGKVNEQVPAYPGQPESGSVVSTRPSVELTENPQFNISIESPHGTMPPDSKFYIERQADAICWGYLSQGHAATVYVQAPRQMGKSSLMRRMAHRAKQAHNTDTAFIDFEKFAEAQLVDEEVFLIEFCSLMGDALHIPETIDQHWSSRRRSNIVKCSNYVAQHIIPSFGKPFILAMDETERLLSAPWRSDFFGMLRTWHNDRAWDTNFAQVTLFLSSSTEPHLFIANPNQSPFNVTEPVVLHDFTPAEVEELNRRHGGLLNQTQVNDLMNLLGGHPFLTRLALFVLVTRRVDFNTLLANATSDTGPFGEHLSRCWARILDMPDIKQALSQICHHQKHPEDKLYYRLKGAGLIKKEGPQVMMRNRLYADYFKERLDE